MLIDRLVHFIFVFRILLAQFAVHHSLPLCSSVFQSIHINIWITERQIVSIAPSASSPILRRLRRIIIIIWMHEIHSINILYSEPRIYLSGCVCETITIRKSIFFELWVQLVSFIDEFPHSPCELGIWVCYQTMYCIRRSQTYQNALLHIKCWIYIILLESSIKVAVTVFWCWIFVYCHWNILSFTPLKLRVRF